MSRYVTLPLAAMLAIFTVYAQQPSLAYHFKPLVSTGTSIDGHTLTRTTIDGTALSDAGDIAFAAHWAEGGRERTAVFTSTRMVAGDGPIDGRYVTRILPTSLSINGSGDVAWEGVYLEGPTSHTGLFLNRKLIVELITAGSPSDFRLGEDGRLTLLSAVQAPLNARPATATPSGLPPGTRARVPKSVIDFLRNHPNIPVLLDPNIPITQERKPPSPTPQPVPVAKAPAPVVRACPAVEFPTPSSWAIGTDEMAGPLFSHAFDVPKGRAYDSHMFGKIATPFRVVHFNEVCQPELVIVGDLAAPGHIEAFTPKGMLTHTKPDGSLQTPGFSGTVAPEDLVKGAAFLRINKRGQVLFVSNQPEGLALLLATPAGSH